MTSISIAVAAPVAHTAVDANPQPAAPLSTSNYLGGAAIAVTLAVMLVSSLSAAGILKPRAKSAHRKAAHTTH